jgi:hypothetical protein
MEGQSSCPGDLRNTCCGTEVERQVSQTPFASHGIEDIEGVQGEPAVAADGAGTRAFRGIQFLQPAPLLNFIVRLTE